MIRAEEVRIDAGEAGFVLEVGVVGQEDVETLRIDVQAVAEDLYREVYTQIGAWLDEGPGRPRSGTAGDPARISLAVDELEKIVEDQLRSGQVIIFSDEDSVSILALRELVSLARGHDEHAARPGSDGQSGDHVTRALEHVDRADSWANRDSVPSPEWQAQRIEYELRLAGIHAQLAVAQQVNYLTAGR